MGLRSLHPRGRGRQRQVMAWPLGDERSCIDAGGAFEVGPLRAICPWEGGPLTCLACILLTICFSCVFDVLANSIHRHSRTCVACVPGKKPPPAAQSEFSLPCPAGTAVFAVVARAPIACSAESLGLEQARE